MKRVYKQAAARAAEGGWGVALDNRPMRTPAKHELIVPSAALAEAVAAEWDAQQDEIHPATMPLTRLAATAIDRTRTQRELVAAETANYAGTDLVCYRAEHPPALIARQHAGWQPLIDWAMQRYDAALAVTSGVVPRPQAPAALKAFAAAVAAQDDFRLTALHAMTTACGSLVIALALIEGRPAPQAYRAGPIAGARPAGALSRDAKNATNRHRRARDASAAARRDRRAAAPAAGMRAIGTGLRSEERLQANLLECLSGNPRQRRTPLHRRMPRLAQLWLRRRGGRRC